VAAWVQGRRAGHASLLLLLVAASLYFIVRGPFRAWSDLDDQDITGLFAATRGWLGGLDPYDGRVLEELSEAAGMRLGPAWSLHPPTTFLLLTPLAGLPWPVAEKVAVIVNVLLQFASIAMAMSVTGLRLRQTRGLLFVCFALALAPFHTAISEGQLTVAVVALVAGSLLAQQHDRPMASGLCIALAAALKPQMGLIFLLLLLVRGRWRALGSAALALAALAAIAVGRLAAAGVDWMPTLLSNLARSGVADATTATTQRLNLQALLNALLAGQEALVIDLVTYAVGASAVAFLFVALRRRRDPEAELLLYAGCSVVTLLMVYNRSYAATLLILPLAWAFAPFRARALRPEALAIALATAVFLVPGAAALARVHPPAALAWASPWWPILQLHQVVALLVILVALQLAASRRTAASRPASRRTRDRAGLARIGS
jgi:uncharacterized membrane protein